MLLALPLVLAFATPSAHAQKLVIGVGGHRGNASFGVSANFRFGQPRFTPSPIRVVQPRCEPAPLWVPGHYEVISRQVWIPGCIRQEYVPPVFEERQWRDYCGRLHIERIQISPATWRTVEAPGRWQSVSERAWIEGAWRKQAY